MVKKLILNISFIIIGLILLLNYQSILSNLVYTHMIPTSTTSVWPIIVSLFPFFIAFLLSWGSIGLLITTKLIHLSINRHLGIICLVLCIVTFIAHIISFYAFDIVLLGFINVYTIGLTPFIILFCIIVAIASGYVYQSNEQ